MKKIVDLAYDMCAISSITGDEVRMVDFLETWLTSRGFSVEKIITSANRYNIFAYFTNHPKFSAIYCTHIDTVAPFIAPFIEESKGLLWGRGACDAKGIAASMITAVLEQHALGHDDLALLLTVGEEEASDGAKACNDVLADRASLLVVGEPTDLRAASAQKGSLVFDLVAHGKEAHSSRPHLGDSAVHHLVQNIAKLVTYSWPKNDVFGETFINFGEVHGGCARNMVANAALAKGIMRASVPVSELIDVITRSLSPGVTLDIKSQTDPFRYFVPDGFEQFLAGFGSDAAYLNRVAQPILLGPGSLDLAHRDDERISFHELTAGVEAYHKIAHQARKLCRL